MTSSIYKGAAAVLVVFSVGDRRSFENVKMWVKQISEHVDSKQIVIILVGNKCDIPASERKVTEEEG